MTVYVLILMMSVSRGEATTTAEFTSKDRCEAAGQAAKAQWPRTIDYVRYICAEK